MNNLMFCSPHFLFATYVSFYYFICFKGHTISYSYVTFSAICKLKKPIDVGVLHIYTYLT